MGVYVILLRMGVYVIFINGIENFWNQAKRHLHKFNGIPREHFHLFLKECEWRFNNSDPKTQLKQLNQWARKNIN